MDKKSKVSPIIGGLLFFVVFIGWQFIVHGKVEFIDFFAAVAISTAVGFGRWYIEKRKRTSV